MRTTLTLDDDVAERLQEDARRKRRSFKETVNSHLRRSLNMKQQDRIKPLLFRDVGLRLPERLRNLTSTTRMIEEIEGPNWR